MMKAKNKRENPENNMRKMAHHMHGNHNKINTWGLTRNNGVQEAGKKHIQNAKKKQNYQPRIPYPAKVYCKNKGEIKIFSDKQKLRYFVAPNLTKKQY